LARRPDPWGRSCSRARARVKEAIRCVAGQRDAPSDAHVASLTSPDLDPLVEWAHARRVVCQAEGVAERVVPRDNAA
jgi:hypothetical protein